MHESSYARMKYFVETYLSERVEPQDQRLEVLDVGSQDVNGTYRDLFPESRFNYTRLDMVSGSNVNLVPKYPYCWKEITSNSFDVVISGQCLEHVEFPWAIFSEMCRVLKPEGLLCVIAPKECRRHRYPIDTFRYDVDGMIALAKYAGLVSMHVSTSEMPKNATKEWVDKEIVDCMMIARKPKTWDGMLDIENYKYKETSVEELLNGFVEKGKTDIRDINDNVVDVITPYKYEIGNEIECTEDDAVVGFLDLFSRSGSTITLTGWFVSKRKELEEGERVVVIDHKVYIPIRLQRPDVRINAKELSPFIPGDDAIGFRLHVNFDENTSKEIIDIHIGYKKEHTIYSVKIAQNLMDSSLPPIPPVFDPEFYKRMNPELARLSPNDVSEHYQRYAEIQGRISCEYDRAEGLQNLLQKRYMANKILEIGPFDNPFCLGENVKYFDVLPADELKKRSESCNRPFHNVPEKIHYVDSCGDLGCVDEKFDIVFSRHVIEHQPDLIRHLQQVSKILKGKGLYIMLIPDKRFCFDYFLPETMPSEIVDAYMKEMKVHSFRNVMEHRCFTTMNDPVAHWFGVHGNIMDGLSNFESMKMEYLKSNGGYIDVHAWQFTPSSFELIIHVLQKLNFIDFSLHRLCHTPFGRFEFCAILRKN